MEGENKPGLVLKDIIYPLIAQKTQSFFKENSNKVHIKNFPKKGSLILANHPTVDDSHIWRLEPNAIHAVHSEALKKTGVTPLDRMIALHYSRMIPVYKGEDRQKTYADIISIIQNGYSVIVNPTGETSGTNDVPGVDAVKIGAILRPWQLSNSAFDIFSAYVHVQDITNESTIAKGSDVSVSIDRIPLKVNDIFNNSGEVNIDQFAERLIGRWKNLANNPVSK